jgi:hypothetical protein
MAVIAPGNDDDFLNLAREIATDRDEPLVSEIESAPDGPAVFVTAPNQLTEHDALTLQKRLHERGPTAGAFGIITGLTVDNARELYHRHHRPRRTIASSCEKKIGTCSPQTTKPPS